MLKLRIKKISLHCECFKCTEGEENLKLTPAGVFTGNILGELCMLVRKGEGEFKGKKIKLTEWGLHF